MKVHELISFLMNCRAGADVVAYTPLSLSGEVLSADDDGENVTLEIGDSEAVGANGDVYCMMSDVAAYLTDEDDADG